jgi:hypothetical protein
MLLKNSRSGNTQPVPRIEFFSKMGILLRKGIAA